MDKRNIQFQASSTGLSPPMEPLQQSTNSSQKLGDFDPRTHTSNQTMPSPQKPQSNLETTLSKTLQRRKESSTLRNLTLPSASSQDFSSNDFLSLSNSPDLRSLFLSELHGYPGVFPLGSGGSRLLDGNSTYAETLERDIAAFHGAEVGLLCNSGFDANVGLFSCLPQKGDVVLYDGFIHASVHDGMRASRASACVPFLHNSIPDFQRVLLDILDDHPSVKEGKHNIFVAVEAIYSMDGDIAPLATIVSTLERHLPHKNSHLIVDEAHSTGVLGPHGRGLVSSLGLERKTTIRLHTFGKALASNGAIILCSPVIKHYLLNYARPLIYTTFLSFPCLAAIRAAYTLLTNGSTEPLARNLFNLISHLHTLLLGLQARLPPSQHHLLRVPESCPPSPIFSVLSSDPRSLARYCQERGLVVRPIVPPTVPLGAERIRVCLHAGNTVAEVEELVGRIGEWVAVMGRAKL